ncbi:sugar ABC transporter substrate-binding protein [Paenibacillus spongiae]|uniref:Sugar ABC transporter substrate-binding protein n=1 Tax=Paenibacillus spongiae TaxID=2909671 RepID=A0ABY5S724_9BACL|nr:sugar ABC transporter substrate-binding protein [Paenibacillus spongiae]UVI29726.1 sugar ABC transporter substrate-binding protein [Paenibacillus spongiae]
MKKIITLTLICALVISMLAGCSKNNNEPSPAKNAGNADSGNPSTDTGGEEAANEFGWKVPKETLEINFYAGQDNPDTVKENSKLMQQFLQEKFNVKMNKIVYDVDMNEKLNLMLASGDYPEVITMLSDEQAAKWIAQGKAIELGQYIDEYAPNVKSQLGDLYKSFLDKDGKLYTLPSYWGILPIPGASGHIRYDWWTAMGSPAFSTPDEFYGILKQMQAAHPKNSKGEKTYALSGYAPMYKVVAPTLGGMWGLQAGYKIGQDGTNTHWINTPEGLEMTKFMNKVYRDGMLDPDSFINTFDDWKAKFSAERVMGHIGSWWVSWNAGHEVWQKTNPNWKDEERFIQVKVKADSAEQAKLTALNGRGSYRTIITDKAKNPEQIMKWFNFSITDMGTRIIGWGVPNLENSVWTYENGTFKWVDAMKQAIINGTYDFTNSDKLGQGVFTLVEGVGTMKDDGKSTYWFDQNFNDEAKWKKLMNENLKDTIYDNTLGVIQIPGNDLLAVTNTQVEEMLETLWAKAVTSKTEEEAVKNFNDMRDKLNSSGLKDIEAFRTREYQRRLAEW